MRTDYLPSAVLAFFARTGCATAEATIPVPFYQDFNRALREWGFFGRVRAEKLAEKLGTDGTFT